MDDAPKGGILILKSKILCLKDERFKGEILAVMPEFQDILVFQQKYEHIYQPDSCPNLLS